MIASAYTYELAAASLFEPALIVMATWPAVPLDFYGGPIALAALHDAAARQAELLRGAGGEVGRLTVATVTERGIACHAPVAIPQADGDVPATLHQPAGETHP